MSALSRRVKVELSVRNVAIRLHAQWLGYVRAMMVEAGWQRERYVPTMEEYMPVAEVSFALGPIFLTPLYLVGPKLSEDAIRGPECDKMLRHMSIFGRLVNDLGTYEKESSQGKINSVLLHAIRYGDSMSSTSVDAAKEEIMRMAAASRRELLGLVVRGTGSAVPRQCKELFWNMCKVAHLFYLHGDGFCSLQEMMAAGNAVVHAPLEVRLPSCSDMS